jgi:PAS domain S-box-containing protein
MSGELNPSSVTRPLRVLFVDDCDDDVQLSIRVLEKAGYAIHPHVVQTREQFGRALSAGDYDLILCDYRLPGWSGGDVLRMVRDSGRELPVVLVTGTLGEETAVEMIKLGAADFVLKQRLSRLPLAIQRAMREKQIREERSRAEQAREALVTDVHERVKEANCLYSISDALQTCGDEEEMFREVIARIPAGAQFPEITRVRVRFDRKEYVSDGFQETPWSHSADILVEDRRRGAIEVFHTEPRPQRDHGPFLRQECDLLHVIAHSLGRAVAHHFAVKALRRSESDYRHLFESANDAILIMDAETAGILEANPKAQQTYGLSREQLVGRSLKSLTRDVQRCEERIQQLLREGSCLNFETVHLNADGRAIYFLCSATLIDYRGRRAMLGIHHDITERKRAEERLHLFGRILESSTDAVSILTPEGYFNEQNAAHQALTEYSIEELRGRTPALLIGEAEFQEHWQAVLTNGGPLEQETRVRTKSGREKTVEASVFSISGDAGQVLCYVAIVRDISERRRLQVQLQQAAKMEAVGRLAGGVAHDFNNLLNVIIGYSELMLERRNSGEFLERGAREIRKAADRAAGLTRQLLAFSRQQVLEPKVLDLNEIIAEMRDLLLRMLGEDVQLAVTPAEGLGRVRADPGQIGQVIMNLAANSRDAMPQGGRFLIETANVVVDEAFSAAHANMPPGPYVLLSVTDTGSGMTPEVRTHIFEPFFTTKEKGKGTGLGLATVYGIVKQSGGYIWVYSEPEQGATFKVYLPRVDALPERLQPATAVPAANCRGSETLLVVEDEEGVRVLVRDYLRMNGYTVLEAGDGEEALRLAGEHSGAISLMITDVIMPGMNGRELAERMALLRPNMKVLYISGYAETAVYRKGVLEQGAPFLQKPFGPPDLGRKVRDVLGPEREASLTSSV